MGVECKLLIADIMPDRSFGHARSMLELGKCGELEDQIDASGKAFALPDCNFASFVATIPNGDWEGESGYGRIQETPYGSPLKFITAADLRYIMERHANLASSPSLAYIRLLRGSQLIGLYWH